MADLALDGTGDLLIDGGDLSIVRDGDALVQQLAIDFQFFKGEWFLDVRLGVPYFQEVLIKNPDLVAVNGIFRQVLEQSPAVNSIEEFNSDFDAATRKLSVTFTVRTVDGQIVIFDREFIIG